MENYTKKQFPEWYKHINKDNKLILTDDIDSYFACVLLNTLFDCEIGYFYDFESLNAIDRYSKDTVIGVDLALEKGKTFDNHVTLIQPNDRYNLESINFNNLNKVNSQNYFTKFSGSTTLMLISLFDVFNINDLTDEQLTILTCIDGHYAGYYKKYGKQDILHGSESEISFFNYLRTMEMQDIPKRLFWKNDIEHFHQFNVANLIGKIKIQPDTTLATSINIDYLKGQFPMLNWDILNGQFLLKKQLKRKSSKFSGVTDKPFVSDKMFSFALTGKNTMNYTEY